MIEQPDGMEVAAAEATMRLNASCATYRAAPIEPLLRLEFSAETPTHRLRKDR
jgi:hypothetical protein